MRRSGIIEHRLNSLPLASLVWYSFYMHRTSACSILVGLALIPYAWGAFPREKIEVKVPAGHRYVSVVVDDSAGVRVRNLLSWQPVEKFGGTPTNPVPQTLTVAWDGQDDDGKVAPPGTYTIRGLSLPGLDALYEYSYYNPGDPPWHGYPNSAWGSNHGDPVCLAVVPKSVDTEWAAVVGCSMSEGTDCLFAIGNDGRKKWSFAVGWGAVTALDVWGDTLYFALQNAIRAVKVKDGTAGCFLRPGGRIPQVKLNGYDKGFESMAVDAATIALISARSDQNPSNMLVLLDRETGRTNSEPLALACSGQLAYAPGGRLFLSTSNGVCAIAPESGVQSPLALPGLVLPGPIKFDKQGNLYVFDGGPDQQVKVYSPERKLIKTFGVKGGQKLPAYTPHAFYNLLALAVDDDGNLWTSEGAHPRRQAEWDKNGALLKEFVGSTFYGGWDCANLHGSDPRRAYVWNVELEVDPARMKDYKVKKFISSPPKPGVKFQFNSGSANVFFHRNEFFSSKVSGKNREYMVMTMAAFPIILVEKHGDYRPVAALWAKNSVYAYCCPWSRPTDPEGALYVWSDLNEDEDIQESEVTTIPVAGACGIGWMFPMSRDLEFYAGGFAIRPVRFSASGAPVYGEGGVTRLEWKGHDKVVATLNNPPGDTPKPTQFYIRVGDHLYASYGDYPTYFTGKHVWTDLKGNVVTTRKIFGSAIHGSMAIGQVPAGEMTGEMFVSGVARVSADIGSVMAIQGNYGQAYFLTEDGIFISPVFKDVRNNPEGWGDKQVRDRSWKDISMYQEAFCGWFGKQDDGKCRYAFGHTSANVVAITGLEQVRRFTAGTVEIR